MAQGPFSLCSPSTAAISTRSGGSWRRTPSWAGPGWWTAKVASGPCCTWSPTGRVYFPNGPQIVHLLIQAGADPNFRHPTRCGETALHWAASSDDVDVAAALIDGGADIDVPGGSIGTPLANAVGYGCS